jgi:hypothetical protein
MWVAIVGIIVCLSFTSLAVWKYGTRPRSRLGGTSVGARKTRDGTVLVLEQVTTKSPHEMTITRPGGPMLTAWLPGSSSVTQTHVRVHPNDSAVVLWFTFWHPGLPDSLDFDWWLTTVLIDEHGEEVDDGHEQSHVISAKGGLSTRGAARPWLPLAPAKGDIIIATSQLPAVRQIAGPRKVRLYDRFGTQVAEFDVPFPDTASAPHWSPDPLPVTKSEGDVQVTFTDVSMKEQSHKPTPGLQLTHRRPRWSITPAFTVERDGRPAPEWKAESVQLLDALGNRELDWNCGLSRFERAWKLEMTLARDTPQAFTPDEQWESPLVPLPTMDSSETVNEEATVQQVGVKIVTIGRGSAEYADFASGYQGSTQHVSGPRLAGGKTISMGHSSHSVNGGPTVHSAHIAGDCAHFLVKVEHLPKSHRELFRVHDDHGRELPHQVELFEMGDSYYGFVFVDPAADAQSLRLTVYVHMARTVELFVAPPH